MRPLQPSNSTVKRYTVYKGAVLIPVMKEKHGGQCLFNEQSSAWIRKNILEIGSTKKLKLPKIKRIGAQTSNVSFINAFMTQWYLCCSFVQFFSFANLLHFILRAALSLSCLEVGHDRTMFISSMASWQISSPFAVFFFVKIQNKRNANASFLYVCYKRYSWN